MKCDESPRRLLWPLGAALLGSAVLRPHVALAQSGSAQQSAVQQSASQQGSVRSSAQNVTQVSSAEFRIGGGHSDNLLRAPTMQTSGTYRAVGLIADWNHGSSRAAAQLSSNLEYRDYSTATLQNELYGFAEFSAQIQALPQRITWTFGDNYGQGRSNPFQVDRPENRQQVNVVSTGPIFNVPVGQRTFLRLAGTQSRRAVAATDQLDGDTRLSEFGAVRLLSSTTRVSLNYTVRRADYGTGALNNEVRSTEIRYRRAFATGSASVAVGKSKLDYGGNVRSTPLVDLSWSRDLGARSHLSVSLNRQFVDAFSDFRFADPTNVILSADIYKRTAVQTVYTVRAARNTITFGGYDKKAEYSNDRALDSTVHTLRVDFDHSLSPAMQIGFSAYQSNREYKQFGRKDDTTGWQLSWRKGFQRGFSIQTTYYSTSLRGLQAEKIEENVIHVYLQYGFTRQSLPATSLFPTSLGSSTRLTVPAAARSGG